MKSPLQLNTKLFSTIIFIILTSICNGQWTQMGLNMEGEAIGDRSGASVSMSADGLTVATGAIQNDGNGVDAGHVRIHKFISGNWIQQGIDIDGEAAGDFSGTSVSMSDDGLTVAIGAFFNDANINGEGHVRVYKFISGNWIQQGVDIDGDGVGDYSGKSVSMSADGLKVAIGAYRNDDNGTYAGQVKVYSFVAGNWVQQGLDIDGEATLDESGTSVSMSDDGLIVAIGAPNNGGNGLNAGHVRIYKFITGAWVQQGGDIDGEAVNDYSGSSVSISADGLIVAIGAPFNDGNGPVSGHVRVYKFVGGVWVQQGLDIDGEAATDAFGSSVSMSNDGLTLAIGGNNNNGNGSKAGHVRVFKFITGTWVQQGLDIDGEASDDLAGSSVSMSSDGSIVAVGSVQNGLTTIGVGNTRVFTFCSAPAITTSLSGATITANQAGANYQWLDCDNGNALISGETGQSFTASTTGNYAIEITTGSCVDTSACENITIIGLDENTLPHLDIYPNPTTGSINIHLEETKSNVNLRLTNALGQVLLTQEYKSTNHINFDLNAPKGIYFLRLESDGEVLTKKIIKE